MMTQWNKDNIFLNGDDDTIERSSIMYAIHFHTHILKSMNGMECFVWKWMSDPKN